VIGAVSKNNAQGAAYVLVRSSGAWTQQQELTASMARRTTQLATRIGERRHGGDRGLG